MYKQTTKFIVLLTIGLSLFLASSYLSFLGIKYYFDHQSKLQPSTDYRLQIFDSEISQIRGTTDYKFQDPLSLLSNTSNLVGNVYSTRSINGMKVQVNQVSKCASDSGVLVYATVTDKEGKSITDVRARDFKIFLDGQELKDVKFSKVEEEKLPLSVMLVLDKSASMQGNPMEKAKEASVAFLKSLKPTDNVGLITFDHEISKLSDLTGDKTQIEMLINSVEPGGNTALFDVTYLSSDAIPQCFRKAVVLLTDGRDTASKKYKLDTAVKKAQIINVPIFVIGLKSSQFTPEVLEKISDLTGGQYFESITPEGLLEIYQKISDQLKGQFVFEIDQNLVQSGNIHTIKLVSKIQGLKDSESISEKQFIY